LKYHIITDSQANSNNIPHLNSFFHFLAGTHEDRNDFRMDFWEALAQCWRVVFQC